MKYLSRLFLWLCMAFTVSNSQLPFGSYQHDIAFPSITGEFHTSTVQDQQPIRHLSTGFHLNPPPPLPFLQSFSVNPFLFSSPRNAWKSDNNQHGRYLTPPLFNLFTPNTIRQRPESAAQDDAYRTYLKEEEEEAQKEKGNDLTTVFDALDTEVTSVGPNSKTFVRLNVEGKDYSYTT